VEINPPTTTPHVPHGPTSQLLQTSSMLGCYIFKNWGERGLNSRPQDHSNLALRPMRYLEFGPLWTMCMLMRSCGGFSPTLVVQGGLVLGVCPRGYHRDDCIALYP
jgi:hypothetical protein